MFVVRRQIESYQCKTIHSYDTIRLLCCVYSAKDDTIKIWKSSNDAGELSVSSTLEFKSQDTDIPLPDGLNKDTPTPVPSSVLPYIAIDVSTVTVVQPENDTLNPNSPENCQFRHFSRSKIPKLFEDISL